MKLVILLTGLALCFSCTPSPAPSFADKYHQFLIDGQVKVGDVFTEEVTAFIGRDRVSFQNISRTDPRDSHGRKLVVPHFNLKPKTKQRMIRSVSQANQRHQFHVTFKVTSLHSTDYKTYESLWFKADIIEATLVE